MNSNDHAEHGDEELTRVRLERVEKAIEETKASLASLKHVRDHLRAELHGKLVEPSKIQFGQWYRCFGPGDGDGILFFCPEQLTPENILIGTITFGGRSREWLIQLPYRLVPATGDEPAIVAWKAAQR